MSHHVKSEASLTHLFRRSRTPVRCRACEHFVYLKGRECQKCGIVCHRKCLKALAIKCAGRPLPRKVATFGVDFAKHLCTTHCAIPHVMLMCVNHIELIGMDIKGIYRVAGAKSKMQSLCQSFENGLDMVELNDKSPHLVSSVLKLYLRQLPEPLLLHTNYDSLIAIALTLVKDGDNLTQQDDLRVVLVNLPKANRFTLRFLLEHLNRISLHEDTNQMSASNLGIVFGPTLLRPKHEHSSASIVHINHQSRIIQLLIENPQLFHVESEDAEYRGYTQNPRVASMSDVLPIKTRDSIRMFSHDDEYLDYVQRCMSNKGRNSSVKASCLKNKTHSEPNVLERRGKTKVHIRDVCFNPPHDGTLKTKLVAPMFPGEGSVYVPLPQESTPIHHIMRAFSEPTKVEFNSQEYLLQAEGRSDISNVSSDLSSSDNIIDPYSTTCDETSCVTDTDEDEVHIQEFVAQQLHSVKARLQVLRTYSISTSDSEEETIMKIKCISSAQSEISCDPFATACQARMVQLGQTPMLRSHFSMSAIDRPKSS